MSKLDIKGNKICVGDYVCYPLQPTKNKRGHISIFRVNRVEAGFLHITCIAHLGAPEYKQGNCSLRLGHVGPMEGHALVLPKHFIIPEINQQHLRAFLRLDGMEVDDSHFESIL